MTKINFGEIVKNTCNPKALAKTAVRGAVVEVGITVAVGILGGVICEALKKDTSTDAPEEK